MDGRILSVVIVCVLIYHVQCFVTDNTEEPCNRKRQLQKVDISNHCSKEITVNHGIVIIPTTLSFSVLTNCLNCSLILRTHDANLLTATFYSLGTETALNGRCTDNKLDIYDGDKVDQKKRLSNDSGICGCILPEEKAYTTSMNAMTLNFFTKCSNATQHGEFEIVVSSIKNVEFNKTECFGQFECRDGACVNKNLVCNGQKNCKDGSDEKDCRVKNSTCAGDFECRSGECIDKNLVCNGKNNCPDRSDESNCTNQAHGCAGMFECTDGKCIDKNLVCDGKNNCKDKSDEKDCKKKRSLLFYVLIGLAGLFVLLLLIIVIILCFRYCCAAGRVAAAYRRLT